MSFEKTHGCHGHGMKWRCGKPWNVVECAELMNKLSIEGMLTRRGSVRRFCGSGNDEQDRQKARGGAAVSGLTQPPLPSPLCMEKTDSWLMKH